GELHHRAGGVRRPAILVRARADRADEGQPGRPRPRDTIDRLHRRRPRGHARRPRWSRGAGDGRGRPPGHAKLRLLGSRGTLVRGDAMNTATAHRIFSTTAASVYPLYLAKVEKKGRSQD